MKVLVLFSHGHKPGLLRMLSAIEKELISRGFEFIHMIGPKESDAFTMYGFDPKDVIIVRGLKQKTDPVSSFLATNKIKKICKEKGIGLILSYTLATLPKSLSVSKKTDIPCAAWLHNAYPDPEIRYKRYGLEKCENIIAVSDFIMSDVRKYLTSIGKRPEEKNLNVVYNAIDMDIFIRQADENVSKEGLPGKNGIVVGMFAAMDRNKNPQLLLRAASRILSEKKDVNFWFVGGFPEKVYEEETVSLVKELGISDKVFFLGPRSDVSRIYREIDIFVHPSFRDACPLAPIEAMIWGKPVIASNTGGIPEIVADKTTGFLCEPGNVDDFANALKILIKDEPLGKDMGEKGRERAASSFSMKRLADDIEKVFKNVIAKG